MAPSRIDNDILTSSPVPVKSISTESPSRFSSLSEYPLDEPFALNAAYFKDSDSDKVNLGIGVYRTEDGDPWPLPVVEEVERQKQQEKNPSRHEYLTIQGDVEFLALARDLAFGFHDGQPESYLVQQRNRIASVQTVSGTGANRVGADFLARAAHPRTVWIPEPTWSNHHAIWAYAGVGRRTYPYYDFEGKCFNHAGTTETLSTLAQPGDVVVFHACAHNPTGADPSKDQWAKLAELCHSKGLIPIFDLAYQGFASGSIDEDAWVIKHFLNVRPQLEFCVAQSFSKNFGLYGQRTGALHVVSRTTSETDPVSRIVLSNLCNLVRGEYSLPPRAGSDIVKTVLASRELRENWYDDLRHMSGRIKAMRQALYDELIRLSTPGTWDHILSQIGMFSYTGLSEEQVLAIRSRHHIYMLKSGRISMCGLNHKNVGYVAKAIDDVVRTVV
ncbi:hypothetical protein MAP00_004644 [Monascus purpureus]|nr:hypothetical protein MAP00_004644 [Monascus purpureus]